VVVQSSRDEMGNAVVLKVTAIGGNAN
jgi:hypothetical protein